tara:strand:+ start:734 stop:1045 length:312 start_codon:yes stop_codon:yes gene_type:complete
MDNTVNPGETGGFIIMVISGGISMIVSLIYVLNEYENNKDNDYIMWRPHRVIGGCVIIGCLTTFIIAPVGGIIEIFITNKGSCWTGVKNSYLGALKCICSISC